MLLYSHLKVTNKFKRFIVNLNTIIMSRIVIVEDNPKYRAAAESFFDYIHESPVYAVDHASAIQSLADPTDFAMIDCFFPKETGSGDISLGREVVERMAQSDPREMLIREGLKSLEPYVNLNDPEMAKYARFMAGNNHDSLIDVIRKMGETFQPVLMTHFVKNAMRGTYREEQARDYYKALNEAMEQSEANQPLGIEVAEQATSLGVSLVLVTSTYHHDLLTQPVQDYVGRRGWRLIDCNPGRDEKATPEFWQKAYDALKGVGARF